jgi:hypothetical protein
MIDLESSSDLSGGYSSSDSNSGNDDELDEET